MENLLFSSIGLYQEKHPIYEISSNNPTIKLVYLFYSEEPHPNDTPKEESVDENINAIIDFFKRIGIPVKTKAYDQNKLLFNSYDMASIIINELDNYKGSNIVLDLSTSRVPIKQALARAGEIVYNFFKTRTKKGEMPTIKCCMRPKDSQIVEYIIGDIEMPDDNDSELLRYLAIEGYTNQNRIKKDLDWTSQSQVSKTLSKLEKAGLFNKSSNTLTEKGKNVNHLLSKVKL